MDKASMGKWLAVPLIAAMISFAFATATFGLSAEALQVQDDAAVEEDLTPAIEPEEEYYSFGVGADLDKASFKFTDSESQVYTGKAIEPGFTVTLDGKTLKGTTDPEDETADFFYFYMDNVDVGTGKVSTGMGPRVMLVTFSDGFPYTKTEYFTIKKASIKQAKAKVPSQSYTGKKLKPAVNVKFNGMTLKQGKDYALKYKKNVKVGKGKVTIVGKGQFKGKKTVTFKIKKASIADAKFSTAKSKTYTGSAIKPNVNVKYKGKKLTAGKDYTLSYSNNVNAGVAKIKVKGKGNLKGSHSLEFVIAARPISKAQLTLGPAVWTGGLVTPSVKLAEGERVLQAGKDYTVLFSNNTDVGKASVRVSALGNYSGSYTASFDIEPRPITKASGVEAYWENPLTHKVVKKPVYLSGSKPCPTIVYNGRKLRVGSECELAWRESVDSKTGAVTGTVTITGVDHFTGSRTLTYTVLSTS